MDKNYYFVVTEEKDGKYISYVLKINGVNNLVGRFDRFYTVNICATKKEAEETARYWNECYKMKDMLLYVHI